jgi:hypothetical protein
VQCTEADIKRLNGLEQCYDFLISADVRAVKQLLKTSEDICRNVPCCSTLIALVLQARANITD